MEDSDAESRPPSMPGSVSTPAMPPAPNPARRGFGRGRAKSQPPRLSDSAAQSMVGGAPGPQYAEFEGYGGWFTRALSSAESPSAHQFHDAEQDASTHGAQVGCRPCHPLDPLEDTRGERDDPQQTESGWSYQEFAFPLMQGDHRGPIGRPTRGGLQDPADRTRGASSLSAEESDVTSAWPRGRGANRDITLSVSANMKVGLHYSIAY